MTHLTPHALLRGCLAVCLGAWLPAGCAMNDADQPGPKPAAERHADQRPARLTTEQMAAMLLADQRPARRAAAPPADSVPRTEPTAPAGTAPSGGDPGLVPTEADLAIAISDGVSSVAPGGSIIYTIIAINAAGDNVIGATVSDTFPAALTCTWTCIGNNNGACTAAGSGNIADVVSLPVAGAVTYTASCTVSALASGSLSNTAVVVPPGPVVDPVPSNNSATDTDTIVPQPAHLTGGKTVAGDFTQGGTVTYTITLHNDGTGAQPDNAGHEFLDVLPPELTLVSASASTGTAVATVGTNTVTWDGGIASNADATITIVATVNAAAGTRVSNQAVFAYDSQGTGTNDASGQTDAFVCAN